MISFRAFQNSTRRWWLVLAGLLALLACACNDDDESSPTGSTAPNADYYVSVGTGSDLNPGTSTAPFKTITRALSVAVPGDTIQVRPGDYDVTNGETFPLQLPDSVLLRGDIANQGTGTDTTRIKGSGTASASYTACLVGADGAEVAGFYFEAEASMIRDFGIFCDGVDFTVTSCTFDGMYGGIRLQGLGQPVVTSSIFLTASYGVYNFCNGFSTITSNVFETGSLPVDINTSGDVLVASNVFEANGLIAIQVQHGDPEIESNIFNGSYSATYGAIRTQFDATAKVRSNIFNCATSPCVRVNSSSPLDLGTLAEPGGNIFGGASGIGVYHEGADTVFAVGNTWHASPPVCGSHIQITAGGTVVYGSGAGEECP